MEEFKEQDLRASVNELVEFQEHHAWMDVLEHFKEKREDHTRLLSSQGVDQRQADFSRGVIAVCEDMEGVVQMLIEYKIELEEHKNG